VLSLVWERGEVGAGSSGTKGGLCVDQLPYYRWIFFFFKMRQKEPGTKCIPVILATAEAEAGGLRVQGYPG
jgi:hypothetical protein